MIQEINFCFNSPEKPSIFALHINKYASSTYFANSSYWLCRLVSTLYPFTLHLYNESSDPLQLMQSIWTFLCQATLLHYAPPAMTSVLVLFVFFKDLS